MKNTSILFFLAIFIYSCGNNTQESKKVVQDTLKAERPNTVEENGISEQDSIESTGRQVLIFLKSKNYKELIKYFSNEGVRFSPYGYVDTANSKKLSPDDFLMAIDKNWILTWGSYDGTGDPIKLTVTSYLQKFVYNADYLNAEAVGFNEILKQGNTKINIKELYPKNHFIDYHFSGFDQSLKGMDWSSLRLVFEKQDGQYFLVAIIHDQWTV